MTHSPSRQMIAAGGLIADSFRYGIERYGTNRNRHQWGMAHRRWLLDSGQYIRTSERRPSCNLHWPGCKCNMAGRAFIGESGPELVNFRSRGHGYQSPHSPDCRDRNCRKCDGQAWDDTTDALASCGCTCHLEPTH